MLENFIEFLNSKAKIQISSIDIILKHFRKKSLNKNTTLLNQGEICQNFYFISEGCIRTFYLTKDGNEKTRHIAFNGSVCTALSSFISQSPSFEFIDSLEISTLYSINYKDFYKLTELVPEWKQFYLELLEAAYITQNKRMELLVTLSAKQRYEFFFNQNPVYVNRLSNKVLASYLNISQETLSRLKSK